MPFSMDALRFRWSAGRADRKRNAATPHPAVREWQDLRYGPHGKSGLLNLYRPLGSEGETLPVIVNFHGGGFVYGSKEVYHHYCADLARRGFAVLSFNYRLAPGHTFPAPLEDANQALTWLTAHAAEYGLDADRVFLVGDSAGAQLASQYAALWANPAYAGCFSFLLPQVHIRAVGLNCGFYDLAKARRNGQRPDYLGRAIPPGDARLQVLAAIDSRYPPAHITTACHDFLREKAQPMADLLTSKGVPCVCETYGTQADKHIGHVFHVDIRLPEATACNDSQCAFFRQYL